MARFHREAPWARVPISPRHEPLGPGNAALQWACGRRGRITIITVLLFVVVVLMAVARRSETLSSYRPFSSNYYSFASWRPYLPHLPSSVPTSIRKPSSTALQLENGTIEHVPQNLHKQSPNFHLLLSSLEHDADFCKTTMSAMIMNYPPPTIVSVFGKPDKKADWEREKLESVLSYLEHERTVKDIDLVMLADGRDTWFQLPSEVMIRQYMNVVEDANREVQKVYGKAVSQTIMFGARKTCEGDDAACKHMPPLKPLREGFRPAQYLDADMLIGPVKDLRELFKAALQLFEENKSQYQTVQSVMSTLYGEQMLEREHHQKPNRPGLLKVYEHVVGALVGSNSKRQEQNTNTTLPVELSIGLDYKHALFQPLTEVAEDELLETNRTNDFEPSQNDARQTPQVPMDLPSAFVNVTGPFWRPNINNDPSPNSESTYIEKLEYKYVLDKLPRSDTPWSNVSIIQNTYTGAIPATFHVTYRHRSSQPKGESESQESAFDNTELHDAKITWSSLWYAKYARALLRRYFRTPQSPMGYHTAAVGGDLLWDQRGGRGGVWTAESALWLPWGEVDGVCGTYNLIKDVFGDNKGVWFHEEEGDGGKGERKKAEEDLRKHLEDENKKDKEWMEGLEREEKERKEFEDREKKEKEDREKEKKEKERQEQEKKEREEKNERERLENEAKDKLEEVVKKNDADMKAADDDFWKEQKEAAESEGTETEAAASDAEGGKVERKSKRRVKWIA